jgi:hypothetical protein
LGSSKHATETEQSKQDEEDNVDGTSEGGEAGGGKEVTPIISTRCIHQVL